MTTSASKDNNTENNTEAIFSLFINRLMGNNKQYNESKSQKIII